MRTLNADQLKAVLSMESSLGHIHTLADARQRHFQYAGKRFGPKPELYGIQGMGLQAGSHCLRKNSAYSGVDAACCW